MFFNGYEERRIVRIFPLEDEENVFEYIPPVVNSTEYRFDEETRKKREQIEKEWNEIKSK